MNAAIKQDTNILRFVQDDQGTLVVLFNNIILKSHAVTIYFIASIHLKDS